MLDSFVHFRCPPAVSRRPPCMSVFMVAGQIKGHQIVPLEEHAFSIGFELNLLRTFTLVFRSVHSCSWFNFFPSMADIYEGRSTVEYFKKTTPTRANNPAY